MQTTNTYRTRKTTYYENGWNSHMQWTMSQEIDRMKTSMYAIWYRCSTSYKYLWENYSNFDECKSRNTRQREFLCFFSRILCHIKSKVKNFYIFIKEFAFFVCVFTILCRMYGMGLASAYILRCLPLNGKVFESRRKTAIKPAYCSSCFYIHFVCFNFIPRFECRLRIWNS